MINVNSEIDYLNVTFALLLSTTGRQSIQVNSIAELIATKSGIAIKLKSGELPFALNLKIEVEEKIQIAKEMFSKYNNQD